jgi:two-component system NtrC family sensor kinase
MDWNTIHSSESFHQLLVHLQQTLPQVESIFLVNPDGYVAASSRAFPMQPYDVRQREYFINAQAGNRNVFVSAPFRGQMQRTIAFTVSRARFTASKFDGVIAVTVFPGYFQSFYRSTLQLPDLASAILIRNDGKILLRYPMREDLPSSLPASSLLMQAMTHSSSGTVNGRLSIDGDIRLAAYATVADQPLTVAYALQQSAYLSEWYHDLVIFGALAALSCLALSLSVHTVLQSVERERDQFARLAEATRKRLEAESRLQHSEKMEALGRLTGGVAHDFNNLLTAILGSLELLAKHAANPRSSRLIDLATQAAWRGAKLTENMLAFARKRNVEAMPFNVNRVITGIQHLLSETVGSTTRLDFQLSPELWMAAGDPLRLEVALLNLAANSRDAMPEGGDLSIGTQNLSISLNNPVADLPIGDYVLITVTDTGTGMSDEVRAKAFEPFFTTKGPGAGTGIGLAMVLEMAKNVGGTATIKSAPSAGTVVSLYLPRTTAEVAKASSDQHPYIPETRRLKILLVDDDPAVRTLGTQVLREINHDVKAVDSGFHALQVLQSGDAFDMAIVDIAMPEMSGTQLANLINQSHPKMRILFMTGFLDWEDESISAWRKKGYKIILKPYKLNELAVAIDTVAKSRIDTEIAD